MKKKIHLLPNVITAFGLSCGLFVIFKMTMIGVGEVTPAILMATCGIFLLAALADLLDGAVARVMKAESEFGGVFDCLADGITFGVGPAVMIIKSLPTHSGTLTSFLIMTAAMVYSVCGVLRLVRFNVVSKTIKGDPELEEANKKHFTGLPIPAAAAAAVSANLFLISDELRLVWQIADATRSGILIGVLLLLGYFMVSRWKFPSLKTFNIRVSSFQQVFLTAVGAIFIFLGVLHFFNVVFFMISWSYVMVALGLSITRLIAGKKSKTLEDFEPEPDDLEIEED